MATYMFELTELTFPNLNNDNANFRLRIDVRYGTAEQELATKTVIMPGMDSYWECSTSENENDRKKKARGERRHQRLWKNQTGGVDSG